MSDYCSKKNDECNINIKCDACKNSNTCGAYTANISYGRNEQCEGQTYEVYTAFTKCLPTITIQSLTCGNQCCPYDLIVEQEYKTRTITIEPNATSIATFDCVRKITIRCRNNPPNFCNVGLLLTISGCLTCCNK